LLWARRYVVLRGVLQIVALRLRTQEFTELITHNIERLREQSRSADVRWWQARLQWVERNRVVLATS
jgi:uncharacterized protein (DUF2141 family)